MLLALAIKKTLAHTGESLDTLPVIALCTGPAVYLLGHVLFRKHNVGTWNKQRIVSMVVLIALIPVAREIDALGALALVSLLLVGLVAYETIRFRERRDRLKAQLVA